MSLRPLVLCPLPIVAALSLYASAGFAAKHAVPTNTSGTFSISGATDASMLAAIESVPNSATIMLNSAGGDTHQAQLIGQLIAAKALRVEISDVCMSACADYLLPSAAAVVFQPSAIIAFHQNDLFFSALASQHGFTPNPCASSQVEWLENLYNQKHLNLRFAMAERISKLGVLSYRQGPSDTCTAPIVTMMSDLWLPTSQQLREDWGLRFTGTVCVDSITCRIRRLPAVFRPGTTLVYGSSIETIPRKDTQPLPVPEAGPTNAEDYKTSGSAYLGVGDMSRAISNFSQAIKIRPDWTEVYILRGVAFYRDRQPERAIQDYDVALVQNPHSVRALVGRATALASLGRFDEAETALKNALRIDPVYAPANVSLGGLYIATGRPSEAIPILRETLRLHPRDIDAAHNLAAALNQVNGPDTH